LRQSIDRRTSDFLGKFLLSVEGSQNWTPKTLFVT
jgi:hypothetical protein